MDVTSLLNAASAVRGEIEEITNAIGRATTPPAADEATAYSPTSSPSKTSSRRTSESKTPSRNRTPWNANGYALPLTVDIKSTQAELVMRPVRYSQSPVDSASPKSPKHKFSDSHSSLSSYASSSTSFSHSRISSMSTVGGLPTISTMPDVSSLELSPDCPGTPASARQQTRKDGMLPLSGTAEVPAGHTPARPSSPSDAILISRGALGSNESPQDTAVTKYIRADPSYLVPPDLARAHKRAISAPDIASLNPLDHTYPHLPDPSQPTPSPSLPGDGRSSYTMEVTSSPVTAGAPRITDRTPKCMHQKDCQTNSTLRKAVSHIFGRNKLCTRMIPDYVWVHLCRKHYQRSRYRNAQEYAGTQCELVLTQIGLVQTWSDENRQSGRQGVVKDWSLSLRKREQNRLQKHKSRKRSHPADSGEDDFDEDDRAILNGTAVPDWLQDKCGDGYTTDEILDIMAQLQTHVIRHGLNQMPDIEILPNILSGGADSSKAKPQSRRRTSNTGHQRSQSVGVCLQSHSMSIPGRVGQPGFWGTADPSYYSPAEKRQRISNIPGSLDGALAALPRVPDPRPLQRLPHRPAFNHIAENKVEESFSGSDVSRRFHTGFNGGPLPAPMPRRHGSQTTATLESSATHTNMEQQRGLHQRSHSEFSGTSNSSTFRPAVSAEYPAGPSYFPELASHDSRYMTELPAYPQSSSSAHYEHPAGTQLPREPSLWSSSSGLSAYPSPLDRPRHSRHQSSPSVPHPSMSMGPSTNYSQGHIDQMPRPYNSPRPYHGRQHSFAQPSYPYQWGTSIQETDETHALYRERR
ncbi:hypothetical protein GGR56DRAFT_571361 [Xylariaceae sp. FL0804]|nr:hypothetical protein GGR56DRAFT_571361 [Xylariaceae sp. FL0804]